jgi:lysozyme
MPADYKSPLGIISNDSTGRHHSPEKASGPLEPPIDDGSIIYRLKNGHIHGTLDKGDVETNIAGYVRHLIHKTLHYHVIDNMSYHTNGIAHFTSNDDMNVKAGGIYKETALEIHMNGPEAYHDLALAKAVLPKTGLLDDVIAFEECVGPEIVPHDGPNTRLPSREPYQYHKNELTRGLYPQMAPEGEEPEPIDPVSTNPIKPGAITSTATKPLNKVDSTGVYKGVKYDQHGNPVYKKVSEAVNKKGDTLVHDMNVAKISERGLDLVKEFEGFDACVYKDSAGKNTIGYGHLLKAGESYACITKTKAKQLLAQDLKEAERCVKSSVKKPLTQNQFDSLISMCFNIGCGAFKKSTLLKELNAGNTEKVPGEMMRWTKVTKNLKKTINGISTIVPTKVVNDGLVARRAKEAEMFARA